jgi:hypothetical protein
MGYGSCLFLSLLSIVNPQSHPKMPIVMKTFEIPFKTIEKV